jgi:RNA-directed DNA polymerase
LIDSKPATIQLTFDFGDEADGQGLSSPAGSLGTASIEQPALSSLNDDLMEQVVDSANMERAWKQVRANRGAAGIDGITIAEFPDFIRPRWPQVRQALLEGTYRPQPVRRKAIPKPDGSGERLLGIPTVLDRTIQQAVLQVLTPIFDPGFSESSFGFRPNRSAHGALKQVKRFVQQGYRIAVDMDLSKFFDRVQHDVLMARVARKVQDRRVLRLIGRCLRAGILADGMIQTTEEGTPQGGPLSPLLANVLLDDFDKMLERRGLRFARYADDFIILVRSQRAGQRVKASVTEWLTRRLRLVVNEEKSQVAPVHRCRFLGFTFAGSRLRLAEKTLKRFKVRVRELTRRNRGISMERRLAELNAYLRGWIAYFGLADTKGIFSELDGWIRRRLRACYWKQWRRARTRVRKLLALGVSRDHAVATGTSRKGPWRLAKTLATHCGMDKHSFLSQGLVFLRYKWSELAPLRRTA